MALPYDPLEVIGSNGTSFIDIVRTVDPTRMVPACPDWTIADLADHLLDGWSFWASVVREQIVDRGRLKDIAPPVDDGRDIADRLATALADLLAVLGGAPEDQAVWNWTGTPQRIDWLLRRLAQETAVHHADAARASGAPIEIPTAIAADGIDEFLTWFAAREHRDGELRPGGTVHLHCTDTGNDDTARGEWFVSSMKAPVCTFTREHRKGDAAVRGSAHSLLLWLWRRSTDGVEVIGDEKVARRFRAYTDLG